MSERLLIARREVILAGGAWLMMAPGTALAAPPPKLAFNVFRNGTKVGQHVITFTGDDNARTARRDFLRENCFRCFRVKQEKRTRYQ